MKENKRKKQAERQEKLKDRLAHKGFKDATPPLLGELPIDYEISDRTRVLSVGGIGAMHTLVTKLALQIAPHVFVRPGELRHAEWHEIDLVDGVWKIPAGKMKARRAHAVPLSKQVRGYLTDLAEMLGREGYVFPSARSSKRPMSENTLNAAFRRMGYSKEEVTAHGLRATASTFLNESGLWNPDAIERALAHGDSNVVRGIYHRGKHWDERVRMAQWWSDYLDELRTGGKVIMGKFAKG